MTSNRAPHLRNIGPMLASPRCGARTRMGAPCRSPAVAGKTRCRMHGGAKGSGARAGNRNALKDGFFTREAIMERRNLNGLLREISSTIRDLD
ncbi:HGGxSTG domain-containing protein [Qipengyuania gaetbuli]|uniref:HGGxSTG domain-containing protein n=1 Tax=Qipengyuania gaetbuli TaxID=266952 RepID=UPI00398FB8C8